MTVVSFLDQKPSNLAGIEATVNFQRSLGQPLGIYYDGGLGPDPYTSSLKEGFAFCDFVVPGQTGKYDYSTTPLQFDKRPHDVGPEYGQYQSVAYVIVGTLAQVKCDMRALYLWPAPHACP